MGRKIYVPTAYAVTSVLQILVLWIIIPLHLLKKRNRKYLKNVVLLNSSTPFLLLQYPPPPLHKHLWQKYIFFWFRPTELCYKEQEWQPVSPFFCALSVPHKQELFLVWWFLRKLHWANLM